MLSYGLTYGRSSQSLTLLYPETVCPETLYPGMLFSLRLLRVRLSSGRIAGRAENWQARQTLISSYDAAFVRNERTPNRAEQPQGKSGFQAISGISYGFS